MPGESQEQTMADQPKERAQSEAQFKKAQRATEGAKAMSEYNAERQAERAKTARLKELRLAKEAADKKDGTTSSATKHTAGFNKGAVPAVKEQTVVKRPKWLGDSRATKADKQKKARQHTDQRMKHQDAQRSGGSKVTRDNPAAIMVLSPDDPLAKARKNTARVKK
jgi:hypothetical protein